LNSYSSATGVGNITVTVQEAADPRMVRSKVTKRKGTITVEAHPSYTFTINRDDLIANFRQDVKRKAEETFMYQQHRIIASVMDQIEAAGGVATLTKAQLVAAIRDMAAE
jgi:hypothetical protein